SPENPYVEDAPQNSAVDDLAQKSKFIAKPALKVNKNLPVRPIGSFDDAQRAFMRVGHWLFQNTMASRFENFNRIHHMKRVRGRHNDYLRGGRAQQRIEIRMGRTSQLLLGLR